ncbi:hypothetical protein [Labrenzia sp. R5_0]|uniref:hypothetical protein n=1 Tax=Labrenzia sp. R5_0 TaxID=2821108 RepID=UPI001ADC4B01|nr:hypothetical protein [Labrenzia sp. R5_0]MBO9457935.1 hypothetical protein [Labrenzia sp. R5_0]
MSLAEDIRPDASAAGDDGALTWAGLSADERGEAVYWQLAAGRTAEEATAALALTYGPIGVNQVRHVAEREGFDTDPALVGARVYRDRLAKIERRTRARALQPVPVKVEPLPQVPLPHLAQPDAGHGGVTIFELKPWHCRRPLWDKSETRLDRQFYCGGKRAEGGAWCADCRKIVYQSPEERRRNRQTADARNTFPKQGRYRRWK